MHDTFMYNVDTSDVPKIPRSGKRAIGKSEVADK